MKLREARERKGLSQDYVANKLEVTQAAVSYWESGRVSPCKKYRRKLVQLLGVDEEDIDEFKEQKK